jgi:hypothetical protein
MLRNISTIAADCQHLRCRESQAPGGTDAGDR